MVPGEQAGRGREVRGVRSCCAQLPLGWGEGLAVVPGLGEKQTQNLSPKAERNRLKLKDKCNNK